MEAQQRVRLARPDAPTIDIHGDAPHLAMRRLVERVMKDQQTEKVAS